MYKIINKTQNRTSLIEGNFPGEYLAQLLNRGEKLIVISTYSNTIKVPYSTELNGIIQWEYEDYPLP